MRRLAVVAALALAASPLGAADPERPWERCGWSPTATERGAKPCWPDAVAPPSAAAPAPRSSPSPVERGRPGQGAPRAVEAAPPAKPPEPAATGYYERAPGFQPPRAPRSSSPE